MLMSRRSRLCPLVVVSVLLTSCGIATAQDAGDQLIALFKQAEALRKEGKYPEATRAYEGVVARAPGVFGPNDPNTATVMNNLASLYRLTGQYAKAEPLYLRSLKIREAAAGQDDPTVAESLNNLAVLYQVMGQFAKAEPLYRRSLQIREGRLGKDHPEVASNLNNLALLYREMGQHAKAEPLYRRSLDIYEAKVGKDHPDTAICVSNLAMLYDDLGDLTKAEPLYARSLAIDEKHLGKDHASVAIDLNNLAELYKRTDRAAKAEPLYRQAVDICEKKLGKDHPFVASLLTNLSDLHARQGEWQKSLATFDHARHVTRRHVSRVLPALPESEQLLFLKTRDEGAFHMALSVALHRPEDAATTAAWVINGKAVAHEALAQRALQARDRGTGRAADTDPWVTTEQVRQALAADAVLVEIVRFAVVDFRISDREKKWQPAHYAAWIIPAKDKGDVKLIDLGDADKIDGLVKAVRKEIQAAQGSEEKVSSIRELGEAEAEKKLKAALEPLAREVLHPLLKIVGEKKRLIVSPDAALWVVPWAALPLADGAYAIEKHSLQYVTSGRDLVLTKDATKSGRPIILADPDFDLAREQGRDALSRLVEEMPQVNPATLGMSLDLNLPRVSRLPGTAAEAVAVKPKLEAFAGEAPYVYRQANAQETLFKSIDRPRVLVLSTHGFFLNDQQAQRFVAAGTARRVDGKPLENPLLRCGVLLAGCNDRTPRRGNEDDGILTGLEVVGCDLRGCELVVLSACETGLGDVRNGEGVAGLRQAFQLAGARAVLASLWQVPDRDTALLMIAFFEELAKKTDKVEALRNAQLARIKARRDRGGAAHPFYWAAFTITGS